MEFAPLLALSEPLKIALLVLAGLLILFGFVFFMTFGRLYIRALSSGSRVPIYTFIGMWLRKVSPNMIIDSLIRAEKA